jgi:hypothetical protein
MTLVQQPSLSVVQPSKSCSSMEELRRDLTRASMPLTYPESVWIAVSVVEYLIEKKACEDPDLSLLLHRSRRLVAPSNLNVSRFRAHT